MDPTIAPDTPTRHRRLSRAALVPLLVGMIAGVVILGAASDPTPDLPAKGVHHVERPIPVELGPATVVVP